MKKTYKLNLILGENIRKARSLRKLSQDKFAEMLGVETATLSKIECGKSNPTPETIEKIIEVLNINPYLLYMSDEDINIDETHKHMTKILEKLKQNKTLYRKAYDFVLELSQGL